MMLLTLLMFAVLDDNPALSQGPDQWLDTVASASRDVGDQVVALPDGGVLSVGRFSTHLTADEPTQRLFNRGGYDLFVARHDARGRRAWVRGIGGSGEVTPGGLIVRDDGGFCLAASFTQSIGGVRDGMPTLTAQGATDAALICMDAEGGHEWSRRYGGKGPDSFNALALASDGGFFAGGDFAGVVGIVGDDDRLALQRSIGRRDGRLLKLTPDGRFEWSVDIGGAGAASVRAVHATADGGVAALVRYSRQTLIKGGDVVRELRSLGSTDLAVLRVDAQGQLEWTRWLGGPGADTGVAISSNADGDIAVIGSFTDQLELGDAHLGSRGSSDAYVALLSATGTLKGLHQFGSEQADVAYSVAASGHDWLVATSFVDHASLDATSVRASATSALVLRLDANGASVMQALIGGEGLEQVTSVSALGERHVAVAGQFNGTLEFPGAVGRSPVGKLDAFVGVLTLDNPQARKNL